MSNTTNLGLALMSENQANGYALFNAAISLFDGLVGGFSVKTAAYAMVATDGLILSNHTAPVTYTLPPVASVTDGQMFAVKDITGAAHTNNITLAVPAGVSLNGVANGTSTIKIDGGYLSVTFDGAGYRTVDVIDTRSKRREAIYLLAGVTPGAGAQTAEYVVPLGTDGAAVTWNVQRIFLRVGTAGGAPQATVEKSTVTGAFSASTVGSVTLGSGANEGSVTTGFTNGTVSSGDKVRVNVNALGTAQYWTVCLEIQEQ